MLRDGAATVDDAMGALDGAGLAHIAAHGHFRADSPLFSSLDLADGPLAVHDFERLDRAPHRVVLSACDSGVLAPVGAGELLGLVSALLAIGTAGVVASVAVVNDEATVDVMVDVHAALDDGADLATALHSRPLGRRRRPHPRRHRGGVPRARGVRSARGDRLVRCCGRLGGGRRGAIAATAPR